MTGRQLSQSQLDRVLIHLDISQKGPDQGDILGARRAIEQVEQTGHIEPFVDGQPAQLSLMIGADDAELTTEPEDILDRVKQSPRIRPHVGFAQINQATSHHIGARRRLEEQSGPLGTRRAKCPLGDFTPTSLPRLEIGEGMSDIAEGDQHRPTLPSRALL